jgi:hypothetical protein
MAIVVGVVAAVLAGSLLVGADTSFEPALTLMSERCLDSSDVAVVFLDSTATGAEPGVESILAKDSDVGVLGYFQAPLQQIVRPLIANTPIAEPAYFLPDEPSSYRLAVTRPGVDSLQRTLEEQSGVLKVQVLSPRSAAASGFTYGHVIFERATWRSKCSAD